MLILYNWRPYLSLTPRSFELTEKPKYIKNTVLPMHNKAVFVLLDLQTNLPTTKKLEIPSWQHKATRMTFLMLYIHYVVQCNLLFQMYWRFYCLRNLG